MVFSRQQVRRSSRYIRPNLHAISLYRKICCKGFTEILLVGLHYFEGAQSEIFQELRLQQAISALTTNEARIPASTEARPVPPLQNNQ